MKPGRLISPPETYFVTFSTWQRRRLFVVDYVRLFLKTLYRYRREGRFQIHAFVLMPEHVHLLLTPANDVTLEQAVQLIKGGYSHALGAVLGRKQEIGSEDLPTTEFATTKISLNHRNYTHQNPVERQIVTDPCEYRYCSAFPGFRLGPWPPAAKAEFSKSA